MPDKVEKWPSGMACPVSIWTGGCGGVHHLWHRIVGVAVDTPLGHIDPTLVAVIGTLLGAVLGASATLLVAQYNREREDRIRLTPEKISAYGEVFAKTDAVLLGLRVVYRNRSASLPPFDLQDILATYAKAELVAGPLVRTTLLSMQPAMVILNDLLTEGEPDGEPERLAFLSGDQFIDALNAFWIARITLLAHARRDLRVRGWPYREDLEKELEEAAESITGMFPSSSDLSEHEPTTQALMSNGGLRSVVQRWFKLGR